MNRQVTRLAWSPGQLNRLLHESPGKLELAAREARYRALAEMCSRRKISTLLLGHHLNDQIETHMMRFLKESGIDGLRGMDKTSYLGTTGGAGRGTTEKIQLVRPLLSIKKVGLVNDSINLAYSLTIIILFRRPYTKR